MPRRKTSRPRKKKRGGKKKVVEFTNTVVMQTTSGSNSSTVEFGQLLGSTIAGRKVVLKKVTAQVLQQGFGDASAPLPAVQLQIAGPIWTGSNTNWVPHAPYRMLNKVRPLLFSMTPFLPSMRVPLDSEDTLHLFRIRQSTVFNLEVVWRITVRLLPQEELVTIIPTGKHDAQSSETEEDGDDEEGVVVVTRTTHCNECQTLHNVPKVETQRLCTKN